MWGRRVKDATPYRFITSNIPPHHGRATGEARPKWVAQTALRFCRTVATGGRTAMRQRPPRAGTFMLGFQTKLPRKRGSGGVATMDRPHPYQNGCDLSIGANPGDLSAPFGSLQKGLAAGAAKYPPIKKCGAKPAGGGKTPPYVVTSHRNGAPSGRAPRKQSLLPVLPGTRRVRQGRRIPRAPVGKQGMSCLSPLRCIPSKIAHSHTFIGNYAPPCPFFTPSPHTGNGNSGLSAVPTAKGHFFLDLSGFVRYNNKIARTNPK